MKMTHLAFACMVLALGFAPSAFAYGDPAASAFVIQAILAGAFAGLAMLKGQISRLTSVFRARSSKPGKPVQSRRVGTQASIQ